MTECPKKTMRLWTWQESSYPQVEFDPRTHSKYYNDASFPCAKNAYENVWKHLRTCQIIWCFIDIKEAIGEDALAEGYEKMGKLLWEIDIPEDRVKRVCNAAWHCLLNCNPKIPDRLLNGWKHIEKSNPTKHKELIEKCNGYWSNKTKDQLLDLMFLDRFVAGCSQAIIFHPVDELWVSKNPHKSPEWWQSSEAYGARNTNVEDIQEVTCLHCPGRASFKLS